MTLTAGKVTSFGFWLHFIVNIQGNLENCFY